MRNESKENTPSGGLLKRLYSAAGRFREIECWNWMLDSDLFGVENPADGEIGYCCVMGRNGEHFAIAAYLGSEGLEGYLKLQDNDLPYTYLDAYLSQKCLMASFEDAEVLDTEDERVLKEVGHEAVGPHSCPKFRSHSPGLDPWHMNADEAVFLIHILEQAVDIALRLKENPDMLIPPGGEGCLVRVPDRGTGGLKWTDRRKKLGIQDKAAIPDEPLDEVRLARIRKTIVRTNDIWEIDFFYAPGRITGEGKRPYYPCLMLCVDHESHMVLDMHTASPSEYRTEFVRQLMSFIENAGIIPKKLLTGREETVRLLDPVASNLSINVELTEDMDGLIEAAGSLFKYFGENRAVEKHESPGNSRPVVEFEGLSPREMQGLLYSPFNTEKSPLLINTDVEDASIRKVKFFDHITRYLDLIREREPVKLTNNGNLPLKLMRELLDLNIPEYENLWMQNLPIRSEQDAPYIHLINVLTRLAGFTKKRHGKMTLTGKYKKLSEKYSAAELYRYLFEVYTTKYNWKYDDSFEGSWIIQGGFAYSLFLVYMFGGKKRGVKFYSDRFLSAFPSAAEDLEHFGFRSPLEYFEFCYYERIFKKFMARFGLINIIAEGDDEYKTDNLTIVKSGLFDRLIEWRTLER